ncbi:hypothetical protein WJX84_010919 [Apatococcus fuscideae]|uniref:ABC1 atypical kinase-like domain-containing protein n=1 Tax=Apatococcus fuscideae TaxID=2026836 RepID=A0AAW1TER5_9CHLO
MLETVNPCCSLPVQRAVRRCKATATRRSRLQNLLTPHSCRSHLSRQSIWESPKLARLHKPSCSRAGDRLVLREAASSERISDSQRQQLVNRIETAGVPSGAELRNGKPSNGVVISSTALADSVDYSQQGHNGKQHGGPGVNGKVATAAARGVQAGLNGSQPLRVNVSGAQLAKVEDLGLADPCDVGHMTECAVSRSMEQDEAEAAATSAADIAAGVQRPKKKRRKAPYKQPGGRWSKFGKYSSFQRSFSIWSFALRFVFKLWQSNTKFFYGKKGMTKERVSARKSALAVWLREGLINLGPTFIKIGQQFSTRVDVLSPELVAELEKLQDDVPSFDAEEAVAIVERELGAPIASRYEEFDTKPIAAASLGQVHLAKVNGKKVVVKVQRPGLRELFEIDCKNIRVIAEWLQKFDPKSDGASRDWVAIYDECQKILYQEIDYLMEADNAERFRKNFADKPWIKVPEVNRELTTRQILTMEYCPGTKINRADELDKLGIDRKRLARLAVESYLQQLLTYGFFHADPHPGNLNADAVDGGRLVYYDFGMMGTIPSDIREGLLDLFYGVYQKDPDLCIDALIKMGVLVPTSDRQSIRRTAEFFLNSFQERLDEQKRQKETDPNYGKEFKGPASKEEKSSRRKQIVSSIGEDLLLASADKPFRFPATFTFVVRSFTVLDGIGKSLDPRFDITEIAAPYARGLLLEGSPQVAKAKKEFQKGLAKQNRAVVNLFRGPNYIEDTAKTLQKLERGDLKLRVRALEAERSLNRMAIMQKAMLAAVAASTFVNMGTVLSANAMVIAARLSFGGALASGFSMLVSLLKVKNLEKKEAQLSGTS